MLDQKVRGELADALESPVRVARVHGLREQMELGLGASRQQLVVQRDALLHGHHTLLGESEG